MTPRRDPAPEDQLPLWDDTPTTAADSAARQAEAPPARRPLAVPVSYQGGKTRIAAPVVDLWWPHTGPFIDLCCGSGAVSVEMVNRGFPTDHVTMVDAGPWGLFWTKVGAGTFDVDAFETRLAALPSDPALIQSALRDMASEPVGADAAEVFPILQAGSFGAKALWTADGRWQNTSFRSYWQPTATSSRRSPVNPMMPMPSTLRARVLAVVEAMRGVHGICGDTTEVTPGPGSVVYMDPPYQGTTAYGHTLDIEETATRLAATATVYVSEGRALTEDAVCLSTGRAKGGISGNRKVAHNQEWVSVYHPRPLLRQPPKPGVSLGLLTGI